ncbi:unnamed protein product [Scytosiphon promiscuus]
MPCSVDVAACASCVRATLEQQSGALGQGPEISFCCLVCSAHGNDACEAPFAVQSPQIIGTGNSTGRREGSAAARSPWRRFLSFFTAYPFLAITLALGLPKAFPMCMRWLRLRSGMMGRVMQVREEKQVLILGSLGSGTLQMARALTALGVEVGHDTSDSSNERCRDGTISWAHGIRFLSGIPDLSRLCGAPRYQAFTSTMFQPSSKCRYMFRSWDQCWADECREVTAREYGCALRQRAKEVAAAEASAAGRRETGREPKGVAGEARGAMGSSASASSSLSGAGTTAATVTASPSAPSSRGEASGDDEEGRGWKESRGERADEWGVEEAFSAPEEWQEGERAWEEGGEEEQHECGTPFRRHLLQVRHPLRTVSLLVYKSAKNKKSASLRDNDCSAGRQQLAVASSLFTNKFVRTQLGRAASGGGSDAFKDFDWATVATSCVQTWAWYWVVYNRAMLAEGGVDAWYRVEDTPPRKVASMAGFTGVDRTEHATVTQALGPAREERASEKGAPISESEGGFEVTWEDIAAFPGGLIEEMSALAVELGYEGAPAWLLPEQEEVSEGGKHEGNPGKGDGGPKKGWRRLFSWRKKGKA